MQACAWQDGVYRNACEKPVMRGFRAHRDELRVQRERMVILAYFHCQKRDLCAACRRTTRRAAKGGAYALGEFRNVYRCINSRGDGRVSKCSAGRQCANLPQFCRTT